MTIDRTGKQLVDGWRKALRTALAERQEVNSTMSIYLDANQALRMSGHLHSVLLLAAAETESSQTSSYERWIPAALAVDYLDAFVRVHRQAMRSESNADADDHLDHDILAGDLLFTRATETLLELSAPSQKRESCLRRLTTVGRRLCEVEARLQERTQRSSMTLDTYGTFLEQYGGVLTEASTAIGAFLGGLSDEQRDHISTIGQHLGIAITYFATATRTRADQPSEQRPVLGDGDNASRFEHPNRRVSGSSPLPCIFSSCSETTGSPFDPDTDDLISEKVVRTLRQSAVQHLTETTNHLRALPDSRGKKVFSTIVAHVPVSSQ